MGWPGRPAAMLAALVLGAGALAAPVGAQSPPARVFGAVTVGGAPAAPGTRVEALINGKVCGEGQVRQVSEQIAVGFVVDVAHESLVAGCGVEGAEIRFRVGGQDTDQTATFATGSFIRVDLDVSQAVSTPPPDAPTPPPFGSDTPPPPTPEATPTPAPPTPTPAATATAAPEGTATPTPEGTATATPGPEGTGTATATPEGTATATATATAATTATSTATTRTPTVTASVDVPDDDDDGGGSSAGLIVAAGVVALAAGGGVIYWLTRRGR